MFKKFKDKLKRHFQEVLEIKKSPREIALGFAIGAFFANFPTFGLEFLVIILILMIFKSVSKVSLLSAYIIWNPFITYPLSVISYLLGDFILKDIPIMRIRLIVFQNIFEFTIRYILGSFIMASLLAVISYFAVLYLSKKYQKDEIPAIPKPIEIPNPLDIPILKI